MRGSVCGVGIWSWWWFEVVGGCVFGGVVHVYRVGFAGCGLWGCGYGEVSENEKNQTNTSSM